MGKEKDPFPPPHSSYKCFGGIPGSQLTREGGKRRGLICCLAMSEPVSFLLFFCPLPQRPFLQIHSSKVSLSTENSSRRLVPLPPPTQWGSEDPSVGGYEFLVRSLVMLHLHSPWNAFLLSLPSSSHSFSHPSSTEISSSIPCSPHPMANRQMRSTCPKNSPPPRCHSRKPPMAE